MSIVMVGSTSGSITLQEPAVAGTTVLDLPATSGTLALTSGVVSSLNGSTGALKGAVLTGTTSISAGSTSANVTSQMTNAGWYLININLTLSAAANSTAISVRTSTDNGTTFDSGASNYSLDNPNGGTISTASSIIVNSTNNTNAVFWMNNTIYLYTGSATNMSFMEIKNSNGTGTTINTLSGDVFAARTALSQINAFQVLRISGTRTISSGTINVYYLGQ